MRGIMLVASGSGNAIGPTAGEEVVFGNGRRGHEVLSDFGRLNRPEPATSAPRIGGNAPHCVLSSSDVLEPPAGPYATNDNRPGCREVDVRVGVIVEDRRFDLEAATGKYAAAWACYFPGLRDARDAVSPNRTRGHR